MVRNFRYAWLRHIHKNPHHWQHWILINDDPDEGEILLEIPYNYIIEMICDWWSFSWANGDLFSIFAWYAEHKDYIRMNPDSRKTVEDILENIRNKLEEGDDKQTYLQHYGVKGMKWGVRNGPPYPLDKSQSHDNIVEKAIASGIVLKDINRDKQMKHTKSWHTPGRSYLDGDFEFAQRLVDEYSGTGEPVMDRKGNWTNKERFTADDVIGTNVDRNGFEGEKVRLIDVDGDVFEGYASDYIFPEDNVPEEVEAIVLDYPVKNNNCKFDYPVEFAAPEIKSIEILA